MTCRGVKWSIYFELNPVDRAARVKLVQRGRMNLAQRYSSSYIPHMKIPLFPIYRGEPSSKIPFPYATKVMAQIKWMSILQTSLQLR